MDFAFSEEQLDVRKLAEQILGDQTDADHLKVVDSQAERFDEQLWADLAAVGLLGVAIDEKYGGMGFGFETLCLLAEEVGRTVAPVPVIPVLVSASLALQKYADAAVCEQYLPAVAAGEALLTTAMIEPGGEDLRQPRTSAVGEGDRWQVTGEKLCVPFAKRSRGILLTAKTDDGLGVFLVEPDADGLSLNRQRVTAGEPQFQVLLDKVPAKLVVQGEDAQQMARWIFESTAAAYAAMATGLCDSMMRMTASYTSERQQFGVPIATFQAVGHRAADTFIDVECLRLVAQQAISLLDRGLDATDAVLVAKIWTGDVTHRVSQSSQHLHGGTGVDRDYPLFRYCLWARQIELSCGSSAQLLATLGENIADQFTA